LLYFKVYKSQLPVIERALETEWRHDARGIRSARTTLDAIDVSRAVESAKKVRRVCYG
jgi:hypothetical protein